MMTREFQEGYLYKLTGIPYEFVNEGGSSIGCNIFSDHSMLCFTGSENEDTFFLSELDLTDIEVAEGGTVKSVDMGVGEWDSDGTVKFVICEADDQKGESVYVTVAVLY